MEHERFAVGTVLAGKLRIVRTLGAGGMGAVYEVEHELTRHRRALKLLHEQMARIPSVVERFLREASAAGRIGNSHIVETFDAGRLETGEPYIVMELLQGKTLAEVLEQRGPLPLDMACDVVIQACDAVSAAHAAGIVHRDLKPENLFLCGAQLSFVKILDFGVSKFDSATTGVDGLTLEGSPIGTPYYMSPEQVRGEKSIDARADVYALGVLFYECLTGRKPFVAETLPHLAVLIHQGKYDRASILRPGLSSAADAVVSRAMASDRAERFASAAELSSAVAMLRESLRPAPLDETQLLTAAPVLRDSTTAPAPLPRPSPALTPGVFTAPPALDRKPRSRVWVFGLASVGLAIVGFAAAFLSRPAPEALQPEHANQALPAPNAAPTQPLTAAAPAEPAERTAAPASAAPVIAQPSAAVSGRRGVAPAVVPNPNSSANRSRANTYGLSEDNPFK
jgi:serine/threonine-protein kinase